MSVKSKKYSEQNFHCESGIDLNNLSQWFKEEMVFTYLPDGIYYGKTGLVELKAGKTGPRLIINVSLKDDDGMNVALKYSTQFSPDNYFLKRLFLEFEIDLQAYPLDLESLAGVYVRATVKNNGPYCNVVDMIPLEEEEINNFITQSRADSVRLEFESSEDTVSTVEETNHLVGEQASCSEQVENIEDDLDLDLDLDDLDVGVSDEELEDFIFEEGDEL